MVEDLEIYSYSEEEEYGPDPGATATESDREILTKKILQKYEKEIPLRQGKAMPGAAKNLLFNESLLARVLSDKSPADRAEILRIAHDCEIEKDDPLFAVFLATGRIENLLMSHPEEISQTYQQWRNAYQKELNQARYVLEQEREQLAGMIKKQVKDLQDRGEAALKLHKQNISATVRNLIAEAAFTKIAASAHSIIIAGSILSLIFGAGGVLGYTIGQANQPALSPEQPRRLTVNEAIALEYGKSEAGKFARNNPELIAWVKSSEGKYARNLMQWNQALLSGSKQKLCQKDAEKLGVILQLEGKVVKNGFCLLWVVPPEQIKFVKQ